MKRAIRVVLLLLSLWVLSGGIAEKEAIKQQALEYMKGKYGEEFVVKQRDGEDCVSRTSWGYEIWMYPKIKVPEEDYTSDMEIYIKKFDYNPEVLGRDGKFYDEYYQMKYDYNSWKSYKNLVEKIFSKDLYFDTWVQNEHGEIESKNINDEKENVSVGFTFFIFENMLNKDKRDSYLKELTDFIKYFQKNKKIKEMYIRIKIYDEEYYKKITINPRKMSGNGYSEKIMYRIEIENKEYLKIVKPKDIEKYIKKNF